MIDFHWQNLSDAPGRERHGFWHGRAWWCLRDDEGRRSFPLAARLEWSHGKLGFALTLDLDRDDREVTLHVAVPGASYFATLCGLPPWLLKRLPFSLGRTQYKYQGGNRSTGIRVFDDAIWLSLWEDRDEWNSKDPKWMRATIRPLDIIFGKSKYANRVIEERDIAIPMPERMYPAIAKLEVASWIRARWPWRPFSTVRTRVSIDVPGGIGIPGKGENDYDIGDDAVFGQTCVARTIEEGIGSVVASVLETRRRRGWSDTRAVQP